MSDRDPSAAGGAELKRGAGGSRNELAASRLHLLLATWLLCLAGLLYSARQDPELTTWIKATWDGCVRERKMAAALRDDPSLGTSMLTVIQRSPLGARLAGPGSKGPTVLVFIGPCAACMSRLLSAWQSVAAGHPESNLIIVSRDTRERIDRFLRQTRLSLRIVEDPKGRISRSFNAVWVPRACRLDSDGRLAWIQKDDTLSVRAIAARLWPESGRVK